MQCSETVLRCSLTCSESFKRSWEELLLSFEEGTQAVHVPAEQSRHVRSCWLAGPSPCQALSATATAIVVDPLGWVTTRPVTVGVGSVLSGKVVLRRTESTPLRRPLLLYLLGLTEKVSC